MWDSSVWESFHYFLISVLLKISALFLSAEVSPVIMEVKINPGFQTQKKRPLGHSSL